MSRRTLVAVLCLLVALPMSARRRAAATPAALPSPLVVLCVGDSVTRAKYLPAGSGYPDALAVAAGAVTVNFGVPGDTTAMGFVQYRENLLRVPSAQYVVIMFGLNDAGWPTREPRVSVADYRSYLRAMVRQAKALGIQPALATPNPRAALGAVDPHLEVYVAAVRAVATGEGVPLIDVHAAFLARPDWMELFVDEIHPNEAGQALIGGLVACQIFGQCE